MLIIRRDYCAVVPRASRKKSVAGRLESITCGMQTEVNPEMWNVNAFGKPTDRRKPRWSKFKSSEPVFCPSNERSVHVRRTDKVGTEAAFHPIEEYMLHVEEQFQHLGRHSHVDKKRVYLATDDPSLLQEAKTKSVSKILYLFLFILAKLFARSVTDSLVPRSPSLGILTTSSSVTTPSRGLRAFTTATPRTL